MSFAQGTRTYNRIPRRVLADQPKLAHLASLATSLDVPLATVGDYNSAWKNVREKLIGKMVEKGREVGKGKAIAGAAGIAAAAFGGSYGKLFGIGMEIGTAVKGVSGTHPAWGKMVPTKPGEWVAINNAASTVRQNVIKAAQMAKFMDSETKGAATVALQNTVSIGFYVRQGESAGNLVVFNFQTQQEEERHTNEIMRLDTSRQNSLDQNKTLLKVKNYVLGHDAMPAENANAVPVDPGSEVIYQGEAFLVDDCDGFSAKISNKERSLNVDVLALSRGRTKHTNAHNYAKNTAGGFQADSRAALYSGQFVWLNPRSSTREIYPKAMYELGVLRLINGAFGDGYYALDGKRFETLANQIAPCPAGDQSWMGLNRSFLAFKDAAVKGVDVPRFKLGRDHILEVLGIKTVGESKAVTESPQLTKQHPETKQVVVNQTLKAHERNETLYPLRAEDKAGDKKRELKVQKELRDKPLAVQQAMSKQAGALANEAPQPNTSSSSYVFGVVLVLAALYFVSQ